MAVETRIFSPWSDTRMEGHDGSAPLEEGPSYLRFICNITVHYASRRLGGGGLAEADRANPARTSQSKHLVDDPSIFLDYNRTRWIVWLELLKLPGLHGLDLSPSNWHIFRPDTVATSILRIVQDNDDRGLCGGHYRFAVDMDVKVTLVFSEPKALLRYCGEEVMQTETMDPATDGSCGICLHGLTSSSGTPPVNLPCGHAFHSQCITKWLFKATACPLCRHDLRGLVAAPWASTNIFPSSDGVVFAGCTSL